MSQIINMLFSGGDMITAILTALAFLIAITVSIVLHELGHGWAALINGDQTAKVAGRLSFNPIVHFDAIGFLMLLFLGFGYAKPVPVNPYNFKHPKKGLIMVSLAGVVINFILAVLFMFVLALMMYLGTQTQVFYASGAEYYVFDFFYTLASYMVIINMNLMLFNLLPLGPLDGLKVLEAFCRRGNKVTEFLRIYGQYILWGLLGLSFISSWFSEIPFFQYIDILGLYLYYARGFIAGGIMSLFTLMFGMGTAFMFFGIPIY